MQIMCASFGCCRAGGEGKEESHGDTGHEVLFRRQLRNQHS